MLKERVVTATFWSGADLFARQAIHFAFWIVLARLVGAEDYGTFALLYLFSGIAEVLVDSGLSAALIQRQDATAADESTMFWFNVAMAALVGVVLSVLAPLIADFYSLPVLIPLTGIVALTVFCNALGLIHGTLLAKRFDFRTQVKVGALAATIAGVVAVVVAWRGYGVWALAAQALVASIVTTSLLWVVSPWRPTVPASRASLHRLYGFGGYLTATNLAEIAYGRLYTLLIGTLHGVRALGFFNRAEALNQVTAVVPGIMVRVMFPAFSATVGDPDRLLRGVRLSLRAMMLLNAPLMLGLAAVADPFVRVVLGDRWLPVVPILEVLCFASLFAPLIMINLTVLMAHGHGRTYLRIDLLKKLVGIALIAGGAMYGILGIAWAQVMFAVLAFAINARYTKRRLNYGFFAQLRDCLPSLSIAIPMALFVHWLGPRLALPPFAQLLVTVSLGAVTFAAFALAFRLRAVRDIIELWRSRKPAAPAGGAHGA
jgi:O-antigen/teichoic acid export membrane protein